MCSGVCDFYLHFPSDQWSSHELLCHPFFFFFLATCLLKSVDPFFVFLLHHIYIVFFLYSGY